MPAAFSTITAIKAAPVIDVSGDGANNQGVSVEIARDAAVRRGITINGLPLLLKPGSFDGYFEMVNLDDYYQDCVIGGTGAFIVPVREHVRVHSCHSPQAGDGDRRARAATHRQGGGARCAGAPTA